MTQAETLSITISAIQTFLVVLGFYLTYREIDKWRVELIGSKKIEALVQLGKAAIKVRQAFINARNPITFGSAEEVEAEIKDKADKKLSDEDLYVRSRKRDFNRRLALIDNSLTPLYEALLDCQILVREPIDILVHEYRKKQKELFIAMNKDIRGADAMETIDILYGTNEPDDSFGKEIHRITEDILTIVKKYTN